MLDFVIRGLRSRALTTRYAVVSSVTLFPSPLTVIVIIASPTAPFLITILFVLSVLVFAPTEAIEESLLTQVDSAVRDLVSPLVYALIDTGSVIFPLLRADMPYVTISTSRVSSS